MSRAHDVPPALRAVLETGAALVRRSSTGRVALARVHDLLPPGAPEALARPLREAHAAATAPLSHKDVERTLKAAWGRPPGKVLDELEREPLAVRPAAQVHRAVLDGRDVAVKVRRPGLAAGVRADLALLDALVPPLRAAFPAWDPGPLLREAREAALDELDLEHEASTMRRVRRALRGLDGLEVPDALGDHCADDVLVTTLLEGPTLRDAAPGDAEAVARALLRAHVAAARDGLALTDARPGHVVLLRGGGVGLLGTGVARPVPRERAGALLDVLGALRDGDAAAGEAALARLGAPGEAYGLAREVLGAVVTGPARLDEPALDAITTRALDRLPDGLRVAGAAAPEPADVGVARGLGQLVATLARLDAELDWGREALS